LVYVNDVIHVYVDFNLILFTTSPDDALSLLIAMYTIFELSFNKKGRAIRFLYSVLHGDKSFLSNSIRMFMKEKKIDIISEQEQRMAMISSELLSNPSMKPNIDSQSESPMEMTSQRALLNDNDSSITSQTPPPIASVDDVEPDSHLSPDEDQ
jgi:hypothetical protein